MSEYATDPTRPFDGSMVGAMAAAVVQYAGQTIEAGYPDDYPEGHEAHGMAFWIRRGGDVVEQVAERDVWRDYIDDHMHEVTVYYFGKPFPPEVATMDRDDRLSLLEGLLRDEVRGRALSLL